MSRKYDSIKHADLLHLDVFFCQQCGRLSQFEKNFILRIELIANILSALLTAGDDDFLGKFSMIPSRRQRRPYYRIALGRQRSREPGRLFVVNIVRRLLPFPGNRIARYLVALWLLILVGHWQHNNTKAKTEEN